MLIPIVIGALGLYAYYRGGSAAGSMASFKSGTNDTSDNPDTDEGIRDFSKSHGPYTDPTLELVVGNPLLRTSNKRYHREKPGRFVYGQWGIPRMDMSTQRGGMDSILIFANPGGDEANPLLHY